MIGEWLERVWRWLFGPANAAEPSLPSVQLGQTSEATKTAQAEPGKKLNERYAPGSEEPSALSGDWLSYAGARPELRGSPRNTILMVPGLAEHSPEFRARLLDVAEDSRISVDALATVISSESKFNPRALNPLPAAGLIQLTVGANLAGFTNADKIREIAATWSGERQLEEMVRPYLARFAFKEPPTPGKFYMMNFLPKHQSDPDDMVIGRKGEVGPDGKPTFSAKVYEWNAGFSKDGATITVGNVKDTARKMARAAHGRRITVDGRIIESRAVKGIQETLAQAAATAAQKGAEPLPPGVRNINESARGLLLAAVRANENVIPEWRTVRIGDLEIDVTADALQAPVTFWISGAVVTRPLRLPVSYNETIEIARRLGAVVPTADLWMEIWRQADVHISPSPLPDGPAMLSIDYSIRHSMLCDEGGARAGQLTRDVGKGWILDPRLAERGAVNFGWVLTKPTQLGAIMKKAGEPIQSVGGMHNADHADYSQTCVLIRRQAKEGGKPVDMLDVLARRGIEKRWLHVFQ